MGIGSILLKELISTAKNLGFHKLVLSALAINIRGAALYNKMGFREVGVYKDHGKIDGRWIDVLIMEKIL